MYDKEIEWLVEDVGKCREELESIRRLMREILEVLVSRKPPDVETRRGLSQEEIKAEIASGLRLGPPSQWLGTAKIYGDFVVECVSEDLRNCTVCNAALEAKEGGGILVCRPCGKFYVLSLPKDAA